MTPERLAKVRALAEDPRAHPRMREMAQRVLDREPKPPPQPPPQQQHPGLHTSEEYDKFIFMNLDNWGESANGNYVCTTNWNGRSYRVVLFKYKKTPHLWGWLRVHTKTEIEQWSRNKYATLREAHESAWLHLTLL